MPPLTFTIFLPLLAGIPSLREEAAVCARPSSWGHLVPFSKHHCFSKLHSVSEESFPTGMHIFGGKSFWSKTLFAEGRTWTAWKMAWGSLRKKVWSGQLLPHINQQREKNVEGQAGHGRGCEAQGGGFNWGFAVLVWGLRGWSKSLGAFAMIITLDMGCKFSFYCWVVISSTLLTNCHNSKIICKHNEYVFPRSE